MLVIDAADGLEAAADALRAGQPVVLPTDTIYGLAALPSVPGATDRLFALKGRDADVPIAVLVSSAEQAQELAAPFPRAAQRLADRYWPGALTLVLRRRDGVELRLGGDPATVGIRCPAHDLLRALAGRVGPLAVTSANRHGEPTPVTAVGAATALGNGIAVVLDGGPCRGLASTVVDCTSDEPVVLRAAALTEHDVFAAVHGPAGD